MKSHTITLLILALAISACQKPDPGPQSSDVQAAWNGLLARDTSCAHHVTFQEPQTNGRMVHENQATVLAVVGGEWTLHTTGFFGIPTDYAYLSGPCQGINPQKSGVQSFQRKFIFTKYDTGWRFERLE